MRLLTPSPRRALLLAVVALVGLLAAAVPATADCEESLLACETDHDETYTVPATIRQLSAVVPIRTDNDGLSATVYRALVPDQYDMPGQLLVAVSATDVDVPRAAAGDTGVAPGGIVTSLALRVVHDDERGWYPISQATTSSDAYDFGRSVGLPTYLADASFTPDGDAVAATASVDGQDSLRLAWTPASLSVGPDNLAWMDRREPFFALRSPLEGPDRSRVKVTHKPPVPIFDVLGDAPSGQLEVDDVTDHSPPQKGRIHVTLDPDLDRLDAASPDDLPALAFPESTSLGDLVDLQQQVPGLRWETATEILVQADNLDDGQDGPLPEIPGPDLPAAHGAAVAGPGAVTTGYATPLLATTAGSTVDFGNLDTATHDVTAREVGPDGRPLFRSPFTNTGEVTAVEGAEDLPPGQYGFYCSLHPQMTGQLIVR